MTKEKYKNVISIAKDIIVHYINENSIVIDATTGNGNDTLLIKKIINKTGKIYCFDIQKYALETTRNKLLNNGFDLKNVILINDSHENVDNHVKEEVDFVIFNLGYLPCGNHDIVTKPETTINAINKCTTLIKKSGKIIIVGYTGHPGGKTEIFELHKHLSNLDQKSFNIFKIEFINQINSPPLLYCIEKRI